MLADKESENSDPWISAHDAGVSIHFTALPLRVYEEAEWWLVEILGLGQGAAAELGTAALEGTLRTQSTAGENLRHCTVE